MTKLRTVGVLTGFIGAGIVVYGWRAEYVDDDALILFFVIGFLLIGVGFLSYKSR